MATSRGPAARRRVSSPRDIVIAAIGVKIALGLTGQQRDTFGVVGQREGIEDLDLFDGCSRGRGRARCRGRKMRPRNRCARRAEPRPRPVGRRRRARHPPAADPAPPRLPLRAVPQPGQRAPHGVGDDVHLRQIGQRVACRPRRRARGVDGQHPSGLPHGRHRAPRRKRPRRRRDPRRSCPRRVVPSPRPDRCRPSPRRGAPARRPSPAPASYAVPPAAPHRSHPRPPWSWSVCPLARCSARGGAPSSSSATCRWAPAGHSVSPSPSSIPAGNCAQRRSVTSSSLW